jgi:hypothetical protein
MVVVVESTAPPTLLAQTPPVSWSGFGPPGALTKAVVLVKKAVLTVFVMEMRGLVVGVRVLIPPGVKLPDPKLNVLWHWATAADEPQKATDNAAPAIRAANLIGLLIEPDTADMYATPRYFFSQRWN